MTNQKRGYFKNAILLVPFPLTSIYLRWVTRLNKTKQRCGRNKTVLSTLIIRSSKKITESSLNSLSDIATLSHQKVSNIDQKLTLATPLPGASAEQHVLLNSVPQTTKRQVKMADMFVPSPGLYNVSSPNSSIYDMDRSEQMVTCCVSSFSNPSDSTYTDEIGLDDKLEDSSIHNFFTPDVMSSFQSAPGINRINFWSDKMDSDVPVTELIDILDTNPTLTQLNMEPEMSFVSDILNLDQEDSKMSYSLDFLCADINNGIGCQYNLTASSADSPSNVTHPAAGFSSFHKVEQKSLVNVGQEYVKSANQNKSSFPPRAQQPTIIGVVAPVKSNPEDNVTKSYSLHELLTKNRVKSESLNKLNSHNVSSCDKTAQIVPSSNPLKRTACYLVKEEPLSPSVKVEIKDESTEDKISDSVEEKTVVKDESTDDKWKDIQKFIHSPEMDTPPKKRSRYDSGSSSHISDDEDDDDDKEDEFDDDDYSDIDADIAQISPKDCESLVATGKKQKQFFWQYNIQSKGPKGTRLKLAVESPADPHVLNDFEDPVFDECNTTIAGIRHGGKARKGDGNEITPNPKKLFMIGHQLMKLSRQINACQLGADVPTAKRNESRKEKNKLASRACRLKKKAQHEANKIKLYGLEQEHGQLNSVLHFIWPFIQERAKSIMEQSKMSLTSPTKSLTAMLEAAIAQSIKDRIAENTTEYVNSIILKVENGELNGGLTIKKNRKS